MRESRGSEIVPSNGDIWIGNRLGNVDSGRLACIKLLSGASKIC